MARQQDARIIRQPSSRNDGMIKTFVAILTIFLLFAFHLPCISAQSSQEPPVNFLFRDTFYAPPALKLKYDVYETVGLLLVRDNVRGRNSEFAVVTGFKDPILESRILKNIRSIEEANSFLEKNVRKIFYERIPIKELPITAKDGTLTPRYWVGQRAFDSLEAAKAKIVEVKAAIQAGGGNFDRGLELITEYFPEEPAPTPEEIRANFIKEEELVLKMWDWLDIGERSYGPLALVPEPLLGAAVGEPILWQAFGDTSFRFTNLDSPAFNSQVGYWTNRLVFRGLRLIGEPTLDPYVEVTMALESNGKNFPSHLDLIAGLEYRPTRRMAFFENFNVDGLHVLAFLRNYRFFIQYMERKNLTDEIADSQDTDLWIGANVFYEWGLDLNPPSWLPSPRERVSDWVRDYVWGEYFGEYRYEETDFSTIDSFHSWILNSSIIFGVKWPTFALPKNPINDQFTLMPYIRLEHTTNRNRAGLSYQNRFFLAPGIRWMPFRSYQFQNNEWLFLTKIYAEYIGGIGSVENPGSPDQTAPTRDWFIGIKTSYKRF